jgi:hypothetical protein
MGRISPARSVFLRRHYPDQVRGYTLRPPVAATPNGREFSCQKDNRLPGRGKGAFRQAVTGLGRFPPPALPGSGSGVYSQVAFGVHPQRLLFVRTQDIRCEKKGKRNYCMGNKKGISL